MTATHRLALSTLGVREDHEALRFFVDRLGFHLVEDTPLAAGQRWVAVAPAADAWG